MHEVVLILSGKDVDIDTNSVFFGFFYPIKSVFYQACLTYSSRRNEYRIASIMQICNQLFRFLRTVTEVFWTHITLINKGVFKFSVFSSCHSRIFFRTIFHHVNSVT